MRSIERPIGNMHGGNLPYSVTPARAADDAHSAVHLSVRSAEELAASFHGWKLELMLLRRGGFAGQTVLLPFGRLVLIRAFVSQPVVLRYSMPAACVTLARPSLAGEAVLVRGRRLSDDECLVAGPGGTGEYSSRGAHECTTLSIPLAVWQTESDWLRPPPTLACIRGVSCSKPGRNWNAGLIAAVDWIADAVTQYPNAWNQPTIRKGLEELLLTRVHAFQQVCVSESGLRAAKIARRNAVERARRYMEENLSQTQRLSDVCRHARIEARSLEYAFRDLLGISPMTYLRLLRLHHARRRLCSAEERHTSVSRTALDCGCWHLSQFAMDYKRLFGESPSATRLRALAKHDVARRRAVDSNERGSTASA